MPATREQIMTALTNLLESSATFVTVGRRLRDPEGLRADEAPALFVVEHEDTYKRPVFNAPPIREMNVMAIVYADGGNDQTQIPAAFINNMLDVLDGLLKGENAVVKKNTLGGLVEACFIEGQVLRSSGNVTGQAWANIPIRIVIP